MTCHAFAGNTFKGNASQMFCQSNNASNLFWAARNCRIQRFGFLFRQGRALEMVWSNLKTICEKLTLYALHSLQLQLIILLECNTPHTVQAHMGLTKSSKVKEKHSEGFILVCSIPLSHQVPWSRAYYSTHLKN